MLKFEALLRFLRWSEGVSGMHEAEEGDDAMPDRSDFKSVSAARHAAFAEVRTVAGGGEVDWPLNPAVHVASEP
jgi:hypothetical protein